MPCSCTTFCTPKTVLDTLTKPGEEGEDGKKIIKHKGKIIKSKKPEDKKPTTDELDNEKVGEDQIDKKPEYTT